MTQLGGGFVLDSQGEVVYEYKDEGILKYINIKSALKTVNIDLI